MQLQHFSEDIIGSRLSVKPRALKQNLKPEFLKEFFRVFGQRRAMDAGDIVGLKIFQINFDQFPADSRLAEIFINIDVQNGRILAGKKPPPQISL